MSKKALRLPDYIEHMRLAVARLQRYTDGKTMDDFVTDEQLQDAVVRNIEVIGEAARNIATHAPKFCQHNNHVPWSALYAMRNRLSHGYWEIDLSTVWRVVQRDLPALEAQLDSLSTPPDDDAAHEIHR